MTGQEFAEKNAGKSSTSANYCNYLRNLQLEELGKECRSVILAASQAPITFLQNLTLKACYNECRLRGKRSLFMLALNETRITICLQLEEP